MPPWSSAQTRLVDKALRPIGQGGLGAAETAGAREKVFDCAGKTCKSRPRWAELEKVNGMTPSMTLKRRMTAVALGLSLLAAVPTTISWAGPSDPAAARIGGLYGTLLDIMKQAKQLGVKGRFDKLAPVLVATYDVAAMSKSAVGPSWDTLQPAQQAGIQDAFGRMMIATYASRFDDFGGEQLNVMQTVDQPPADKLVKTQIMQSNGKPVALNYLMRGKGNDWKVVDVYLDGTISELASRRAEFGTILKTGGADALIASLRQRGDKLLAGG
jgi:phospholipid transport system substrate-binding protein